MITMLFARQRARRSVARIAVAVAITASVHAAGAQRPQAARSDSMPREFVEALLGPAIGLYGGTTTNFVIGKIPPGLAPFLYVPPNSRVLGGIESMSTTIAVFNVSMSLEELRATYQREQVKLGWAPPPTMEAIRGWGFMQPPGVNPTSGLEFCHIGQSLQLNPVPAALGTMNVTARVQSYGSQCSVPTRPGGRSPPPIEAPTLYNPPGASMNAQECYAASGSASGIPTSTAERLQTRLSPTQLADLFAKQLADSGWVSSAVPAAVHRVWTHPDSAGTEREVTLTITPSAVAGCHDVGMQVRRVLKR